jgi:hypothetical protein
MVRLFRNCRKQTHPEHFLLARRQAQPGRPLTPSEVQVEWRVQSQHGVVDLVFRLCEGGYVVVTSSVRFLLGAFSLAGLVRGGGRATVRAAAIVEPPWRSSPPTVETVSTMGTTVTVVPTFGLPTRPSHTTLSPLSRVPSLLKGPSLFVCLFLTWVLVSLILFYV